MPTATTSRRRATRVVTLGDGTEKQVLCYTDDWARNYFEARGHTVVGVRKRRKAEDFVMPENAGWTLSALGLRQLCKEMGLEWDVEITKSNVKGGRRGAYKAPIRKNLRNVHQISIKSWLDPAQAEKTIRHELAHAAQAERLSRRFPHLSVVSYEWRAKWARDYKDGTAYHDKPMEVEARSYETKYPHIRVTR